MKLRNTHITIGLAFMCWAGIFLLASSVFGQQAPTRADERHSRVFAQAVLEAEDGATLYADEYSPAIKEAIEFPAWKSLTIVGGTFRAAGRMPAVRGGYWARRLSFEGSSFLAATDGLPSYGVSIDAELGTLTDCYVEGPVVAWWKLFLVDTYIDAGTRQREDCAPDNGVGFPGVNAIYVGVRGGVILGQSAARSAPECECTGQAGGVGVWAYVVALSQSSPPLIMGGFGECGTGPRGEPIQSFSVVWGDG